MDLKLESSSVIADWRSVNFSLTCITSPLNFTNFRSNSPSNLSNSVCILSDKLASNLSEMTVSNLSLKLDSNCSSCSRNLTSSFCSKLSNFSWNLLSSCCSKLSNFSSNFWSKLLICWFCWLNFWSKLSIFCSWRLNFWSKLSIFCSNFKSNISIFCSCCLNWSDNAPTWFIAVVITFICFISSFVAFAVRPVHWYISQSNPSIRLRERSSNKLSFIDGFSGESSTKTSDTTPSALGVDTGSSSSNEIRSADSLMWVKLMSDGAVTSSWQPAAVIPAAAFQELYVEPSLNTHLGDLRKVKSQGWRDANSKPNSSTNDHDNWPWLNKRLRSRKHITTEANSPTKQLAFRTKTYWRPSVVIVSIHSNESFWVLSIDELVLSLIDFIFSEKSKWQHVTQHVSP